MSASMKGQALQTPQYLQRVAQQLATTQKARHSASKYDFVKVKVWVGENLVHYYVLSRFLISRMLTVTKIPQMKAVKIALEVKKYLVDNDFMDISQEHFEAILFNVLRARGFGDEYVDRYKMVTKFFQQRRPLIVLICGVPCTGKSSLAQQLASRLNMPNVLQTDALYELMRMTEDGPLQPAPLWQREDLEGPALVREYLRESRIVRKGLDGSLGKCLLDGKSIIMEGMHLDPGLYLYEFARYSQAHLSERLSKRRSLRSPDLKSSVSEEQHAALRDSPSEDAAAALSGRDCSGDPFSVGARSASASSPLHHESDPDWNLQITRRSASFMLSSAGRMSPVLARGPQLVPSASDGLAMQPMRPGDQSRQAQQGAGSKLEVQRINESLPEQSSTAEGRPTERTASRQLPIPGGTARQGHAPQKPNSLESGSFLSLSPTMQWLQMASKAGKTLLPRSASKPQDEMFSFSPPSRPTDKLPHSSSPAGSVRRDRDATAAAQLSQLHFADRLPGASLQHALAESIAGPDGGPCEHDSSGSPGHGSNQHTAAATKEATLPAIHPNASQPESAHLHRGNSHSAAQPGRGGSAKGSVSEARERPSAGEAAGQQPVLPTSSRSSGTEGSASASGQRRASQDSGLQPGPVFVPIVLTMDDADHEHLVEEWVLRQTAAAQAHEAPLDSSRVLDRLRLLQSHLCAYAQRSVPVVNLELASFNDTLDGLHDYLLLCIQIALEEDEAALPVK